MGQRRSSSRPALRCVRGDDKMMRCVSVCACACGGPSNTTRHLARRQGGDKGGEGRRRDGGRGEKEATRYDGKRAVCLDAFFACRSSSSSASASALALPLAEGSGSLYFSGKRGGVRGGSCRNPKSRMVARRAAGRFLFFSRCRLSGQTQSRGGGAVNNTQRGGRCWRCRASMF